MGEIIILLPTITVDWFALWEIILYFFLGMVTCLWILSLILAIICIMVGLSWIFEKNEYMYVMEKTQRNKLLVVLNFFFAGTGLVVIILKALINIGIMRVSWS